MKIKDLSKQELIDKVIEDIRENEYDSRDLLYDMAEAYLDTKSKEQILAEYFADIENEDDGE